ncbi:MAG: hypothetical protein GOV01_03995, partial [Candidatus Altiarchaeota archaeon]|nr:hypothetical protein [Candidatus Altiarchaeota archaeon]
MNDFNEDVRLETSQNDAPLMQYRGIVELEDGLSVTARLDYHMDKTWDITPETEVELTEEQRLQMEAQISGMFLETVQSYVGVLDSGQKESFLEDLSPGLSRRIKFKRSFGKGEDATKFVVSYRPVQNKFVIDVSGGVGGKAKYLGKKLSGAVKDSFISTLVTLNELYINNGEKWY